MHLVGGSEATCTDLAGLNCRNEVCFHVIIRMICLPPTMPIANVTKNRLGGITSAADIIIFMATGTARQKDFSPDAKLSLAAEIETPNAVSAHRYAKWENTLSC